MTMDSGGMVKWFVCIVLCVLNGTIATWFYISVLGTRFGSNNSKNVDNQKWYKCVNICITFAEFTFFALQQPYIDLTEQAIQLHCNYTQPQTSTRNYEHTQMESMAKKIV